MRRIDPDSAASSHETMENYLNMEWKLKEYEDVLFGDFELEDKQYLETQQEIEVLIPRLDECLGHVQHREQSQ